MIRSEWISALLIAAVTATLINPVRSFDQNTALSEAGKAVAHMPAPRNKGSMATSKSVSEEKISALAAALARKKDVWSLKMAAASRRGFTYCSSGLCYISNVGEDFGNCNGVRSCIEVGGGAFYPAVPFLAPDDVDESPFVLAGYFRSVDSKTLLLFNPLAAGGPYARTTTYGAEEFNAVVNTPAQVRFPELKRAVCLAIETVERGARVSSCRRSQGSARPSAR